LDDTQFLNTSLFIVNLTNTSKIITTLTQSEFLASCIPDLTQNTQVKLLYRAVKTEWKFEDFHKNCGKQGPTVVVIKAENGRLCGGFASQSWRI
jgi:hypothetical protein